MFAQTSAGCGHESFGSLILTKMDIAWAGQEGQELLLLEW